MKHQGDVPVLLTASAGVSGAVVRPMPRAGRARALLRATRPKQWLKNVLVWTPVLGAGAWGRAGVVSAGLIATVGFTLVASALYLVNDVCDAARDRLHPVKQYRPVASGDLPVGWALGGALVSATAAFTLAGATRHGELGDVLMGYLAVSLAYSVALKHIPGLEILIVAFGFVWRPIAGAEATGISTSGWFLQVCCGAALTVAVGKRIAELDSLHNLASSHRSSLRFYRQGTLRWVRRLSSLATLVCYLGWAVSRWQGAALIAAAGSAVPVAVALCRYGSRNDRGYGGAPEDLLLSDRPLQVSAVLWVVLFVAVSHV